MVVYVKKNAVVYGLSTIGETYLARVALRGGTFKIYNLPVVERAGTVLKIRENKGADSLVIAVTATYENGSYYLIGQSRGVVSYGAAVTLVNNAVRVKIPTSFFPTGITHFTLLNDGRQPVNERLVFINHHDNLHIALMPGKSSYTLRDSIAFQLQVTDKEGNPVAGNFSLAVTDDSQVKTDGANGNIISNLLLTSDLKGDINQPAYYFQPDSDGNIKQQLDNLLLTQGWVGYDWRDVLGAARKNLYRPERDFEISGRVVNVFSKPLANTSVIIFSKKPVLVMETVTGKDGRFVFKHIIPLDTPIFIVQARNKNGKSFNVSVAVDEFNAPVLTSKPESAIPWYVNSDSTLMNFIKTNITAKREQEISGGGHVLNEVVISAKKFIRNSQNLNGSGNADQVIDEQELEKAGKKTFLDLLNEKVKGFKEQSLLLSGPTKKAADDQKFARFILDIPDDLPVSDKDQDWYFINGKPVKFIIDGTPLYKVISSNPSGDSPYIINVIDYLKSHSAEDIKGIEVNSSSKYASSYVPISNATDISAADIAFIEITTRSGGGPGISNTPGTYVYKPMPFSLPKQFYSPRYTVQNNYTTIKDYRSTIYWVPNVVTDKNGKGIVSFYGADRMGTYTVILEGTDWNGALGSTRATITIAGK